MDDLFIINGAGLLLYSWHLKKGEGATDDILISGFLTALNSFATIERGEDIKSLKLKETIIIFERFNDFEQKLTFVVTTKDADLKKLLHSLIQNIIFKFTDMFKDLLNKEFDGEITKFNKFDNSMEKIIFSHGLDSLEDSINQISSEGFFKSLMFLEPESGQILYIHAKQFVNKEKLSFLIPLIVNSAQFLYQKNLKENISWILITTARNENLLVETRKHILIVKQYQLSDSIEEDYLNLDFIKGKNKYLKKPKKITERFEKLICDPNIKQIFLVDLVGKIFYSKLFDETYDYTEFVPENISFLTSAKKVSEETYNRDLFTVTIGGEKLATICFNFNNFCLIMIGNVKDLNQFQTIQKICMDIFNQIK